MNSFSVCIVSFVCMCVTFFLCFCVANELFRPWPAFIGCLLINSIQFKRRSCCKLGSLLLLFLLPLKAGLKPDAKNAQKEGNATFFRVESCLD